MESSVQAAQCHWEQNVREGIVRPLRPTGAYRGRLSVLVEPHRVAVASTPSADEQHSSTYGWWRHFLEECGFPSDAPSDTFLPLGDCDLASQWRQHIVRTLGRLGPLSDASVAEDAETLGELWAAVKSAARKLGMQAETLVPRPTFAVPHAGVLSLLPPLFFIYAYISFLLIHAFFRVCC